MQDDQKMVSEVLQQKSTVSNCISIGWKMEEYWTSQAKYYSIFKFSKECKNCGKFAKETWEKQLFEE